MDSSVYVPKHSVLDIGSALACEGQRGSVLEGQRGGDIGSALAYAGQRGHFGSDHNSQGKHFVSDRNDDQREHFDSDRNDDQGEQFDSNRNDD